MLAFLSHSHKDKRVAARIKTRLKQYGVEVFLAHKDISPSEDWEQTIVSQLKRCEVFLPLLTKDFRKSLWTDQETGMAFSLGKFIIPLRISTNPYGFISKVQALKLGGNPSSESAWKIVRTLASHRQCRREVQNGVIGLFVESGSFKEAVRNVKKLRVLSPFSTRQLNTIVEGSGKNQNIYGSWRTRPYLDKLVAGRREKVRRTLVARYRKQVKDWDTQ